MGNTVSAAELAAAQIIHPNDPEIQKSSVPHHHHHHRHNFDIKGGYPEECPMHKKQPAASECPVGGGQGDINPLNMASFKKFESFKLT